MGKRLGYSAEPDKKGRAFGALYFELTESEGFEPPLGCPKPDFELDGLRFQNKRLGAIASANDIGSPNFLALALNEDREIADR